MTFSASLYLPVSRSTRVYVQIVSLLQWHDNTFGNKQTFELVSIPKPIVSLLQWHLPQCDGLLALIALPTSEPVLLPVHVQLVSLLQWHDPNRPLS